MTFDHVEHVLVQFSHGEESVRLLSLQRHHGRLVIFPGTDKSLVCDVGAEAAHHVSDGTDADVASSSISNVASKETEEDALATLSDTTVQFERILEQYMHNPRLMFSNVELLVGEAFSILEQLIQLSDTVLSDIVLGANNINSMLGLEFICYHIYNVAKVVGLRRCFAYAPNAVRYLVPVISVIELLRAHEQRSPHSRYENRRWCVEYVFLSWLSLLVYTPFELDTIWRDESGGSNTLVRRILSVAIHYVIISSKARDACGILLSTFYGRPDIGQYSLHEFLSYCSYVLSPGSEIQSEATVDLHNNASIIDSSPMISGNTDKPLVSREIPPTKQDGIMDSAVMFANNHSVALSKDEHAQIGVLTVLKQMLKHMLRQDIAPHLGLLTRCLLDSDIAGSSACRRLKAGCIGRLALHILPPSAQTQRYRRKLRKMISTADTAEVIMDDVAEFEMDPRVESIVEQLLISLVDRDIRVRWASAKSIGRISTKLPMYLNEQIIEYILDVIQQQYDWVQRCFVKGESAVHGGCLAIAEILRGGILHPNMLGQVLDCVVLTLDFDLWRGKGSAGCGVRDASCYICWAVVRHYPKSAILPEHIVSISKSLVNMSLFDISINCRRAACAAFQELVGRIGDVAHGLDLIVIMDYFSVANRRHAFVDLSERIARYGFYTLSMVDHLLRTKLHHPDMTTRRYAARAIARICLALVNTPYGQVATRNGIPVYIEIVDHCLECVGTKNPAIIHGSLCTLSHILDGLVACGELLQDPFDRIKQVPVIFERQHMFRIKGGVIFRQSICELVRSICNLALATKSLHLDIDDLRYYVTILKDSIRSFTVEVQVAAVEALRPLLIYLCNTDIMESRRLVQYLIDSLVDKQGHVAAMRGYALSLSACPISLSKEFGEQLIQVLSREILTNYSMAEFRDAQIRQHVMISLLHVLESTLEIDISSDTTEMLIEALEYGSSDYEIDSRGDVGSWVREVTIETICYLLTILNNPGNKLLKHIKPEHIYRMATCLIKVCLEPLDNTRARSTFLFAHLFDSGLRIDPCWIWKRVFYGTKYEYGIARTAVYPNAPVDLNSSIDRLRSPGKESSLEDITSDAVGNRKVMTPHDSAPELALQADRSHCSSQAKPEPEKVVGVTTEKVSTESVLTEETSAQKDDHVYSLGVLQEHKLMSVIATNINWHVAQSFNIDELLESADNDDDTYIRTSSHVSLRIPGYSLSPLCTSQFMYLLYAPRFSELLVHSLVNLLSVGSNQQLWNEDTLDNVIVDFLKQHGEEMVKSSTGRVLRLRDMVLLYVTEYYQTSITGNNSKACINVASATRYFVSHRVMDTSDQLVDMLSTEARQSANYNYLKAIFKCLHALYEHGNTNHVTHTALKTMLWFLCHPYPTLAIYAYGTVSSTLGSIEWIQDDTEFQSILEQLEHMMSGDRSGVQPLVDRMVTLLKLTK
ncbi:tubulin-specific chaperone D [Babesia bovis T2Bo]|uniref:Tubulin-folding cofactor D ARM repeats domain-containing protein n=1 Tax=Babesia bovis TaxID=5865 RepID=A7APM8_BABBO|nr:tubulin-specific chaperone D [Babesia bovis T2Bo]EDO08512.1 tubulin-specific chaperone D [Babesia bovis T2Bo]|eukprot:XP_001612080.1 hypothetical protein [Babesia bovis T2Bo]